jgi:hypothetical protein
MEPPSLADRWFHTLDLRRISVGKRQWTARVTGIHLDGEEAWIQIAAGRQQDRSLVLHLSSWTTVDEAMTAMKTRSIEHGSYPRIVRVIRTI